MPALTPEQEALKQAAERAKGATSTLSHHYCLFQDTATPELILALLTQIEAVQEAPSERAIPFVPWSKEADMRKSWLGKSSECAICDGTGTAFGKVCDCRGVATDAGAVPGEAQ